MREGTQSTAVQSVHLGVRFIVWVLASFFPPGDYSIGETKIELILPFTEPNPSPCWTLERDRWSDRGHWKIQHGAVKPWGRVLLVMYTVFNQESWWVTTIQQRQRIEVCLETPPPRWSWYRWCFDFEDSASIRIDLVSTHRKKSNWRMWVTECWTYDSMRALMQVTQQSALRPCKQTSLCGSIY